MFEIKLANGRTYECSTALELCEWYERNTGPVERSLDKKTESKKPVLKKKKAAKTKVEKKKK